MSLVRGVSGQIYKIKYLHGQIDSTRERSPAQHEHALILRKRPNASAPLLVRALCSRISRRLGQGGVISLYVSVKYKIFALVVTSSKERKHLSSGVSFFQSREELNHTVHVIAIESLVPPNSIPQYNNYSAA